METLLRDWVSINRAMTPQDKSAPLWDAAVEIILALDQHDQTPDITPATCEVTAGFLLALGQAQLLRRLAELNSSFEFVLDVKSHSDGAEALARIGASWPPEVGVSLAMDADLASEALSNLNAFVQHLARLSLHVTAHGVVEESQARAMQQMVGKRRLQALSLNIDPLSTPIVQALSGIRADSICIVHAPPNARVASASAQTATRDQIAAYQNAVAELVCHCAAGVLRLPQSHLNVDLSVRLLASHGHWETVEFSMANGVPILEWLRTGKKSVDRLELNHWARSRLLSLDHLLALAEKNRVHTIVFHDVVDLDDLSKALDKHLLRSTYVFECIEACFVVDHSDGDSDSSDSDSSDIDEDSARDGAFEREVVRPLLSNPMVVTLRHKPLEELPHDPGRSTQGVPIDNELQSRLDATSVQNRLVPLSERLSKVQRAVEMRRLDAIQVVASSLFARNDSSERLDQLDALPLAFYCPQGSFDDMPVFEPGIEGSFELLEWFGLPEWLVQGALAQCVHDHPEMCPEIAGVLMGSNPLELELASGKALGQDALRATSWLSEDEMARPGGMSTDVARLMAPPSHPDPNAGVPDAGDGVEAAALAAEVVDEAKNDVVIALQRPADAEALKTIIGSLPGLRLTLTRGGKTVNFGAIATVVQCVQTTALAELRLSDLNNDDKRLVSGMVQVIANTGVKTLGISDCSPALTQAAVTSRRWTSLGVQISRANEELFASGQVFAEELCLSFQRRPVLYESAHVEAMVAHCQALKSVRIESRNVNALSLARALERNRSVESVKAALNARNIEEWIDAMDIFWRNRSLVRLDVSGSIHMPLWFQHTVRQLETRNRLFHPDLVAIGSGIGLGYGVAGLDGRLVGGYIGSMLEPADVEALSRVNKAAYWASRRPLEDEIARLGTLLGIQDPDEFKAGLVRLLAHLHKRFPGLSGTAPTDEMPADTPLERVAVMRVAGVPDFVIGQALRHALKADLASSRLYLDAMMAVGAYPAQQWLRDVAGIDLKAQGVPMPDANPY